MTYCENCEKYKFCETRNDIKVSICPHFKPLKKIYNKSHQKRVPQYNKYNNSKRKLKKIQLNKQKEILTEKEKKERERESLRLIAERASKDSNEKNKDSDIQNQILIENKKYWKNKKFLGDVAKGKGGPDYAGIKKMYGSTYTSDIIKSTEKHIFK